MIGKGSKLRQGVSRRNFPSMAKVNREIIRGFPSCQRALNKSLSSLVGDKDSSELSLRSPLINYTETCYSAF